MLLGFVDIWGVERTASFCSQWGDVLQRIADMPQKAAASSAWTKPICIIDNAQPMISHDTQQLSRNIAQALEQLHTATQTQADSVAQLQASHTVKLSDFAQALQQFSDIMQQAQNNASDAILDVEDIHHLGAQGLQLLYTLDAWNLKLELDPQPTRAAILLLVAWMGRHHGEIEALEGVVNCLAEFANQTQDAALLTAVGDIVPDIMATAPAFIKQDLEKMNPGRPWLLLHINYAIIATRSYNEALMDTAFQTLVSHFPEEAQGFFREGMRQMDAVGYPDAVREVMQRYHTLCSSASSLH